MLGLVLGKEFPCYGGILREMTFYFIYLGLQGKMQILVEVNVGYFLKDLVQDWHHLL